MADVVVFRGFVIQVNYAVVLQFRCQGTAFNASSNNNVDVCIYSVLFCYDHWSDLKHFQ
jgi:hypothetical protein